jgi:hypothetical protein
VKRLLLCLALVAGCLTFTAPTTAAIDIPASFIVKPLPIRMDQGVAQECVIFAGVFAATAENRVNGHWPVFSTVDVWSALEARGEAGPWGSDAQFFLNYAKNVGLLPVPQYPAYYQRAWRAPGGGYVRHMQRLKYRKADFGGQRVRIKDFYWVDPGDILAIQTALLTTGPLLVSSYWDINFANTDPYGYFKDPVGIAGLSGHAVAVVGWTSVGGQVFWIVANSYGEMWGMKGIGLMPDSDRSQFWYSVYAVID